MNDDLYCSIFIEFNGPKKDLGRTITALVNGEEKGLSGILCPWADIYFGKNMDSGLGGPGEEDLFLYYRYKLEIEPAAGAPESDYVAGIGQLLTGLWQQNIPAVAACSFEDDLPQGGGTQWWKQ